MNNTFSLKEGLRAFLKTKILFILICFSSSAFAQNVSKKQLREYRNHPHWINMMNDSNVNYFQAKAAFEEYWKGKPNPESIMEGEKEEGGEKRSLLSRLTKSEKTYNAEILQYSVEHKKFVFWLRENAPYVKEDGSIMSQDEREAMVQQELNNRKTATPSK